MAHCTQPNCNWKGKKSGLPIHLARQHGIHPQHDSDSNVLASESKICPVPGCGESVPDLLTHLQEFHDSWRLSDGRFVFEVV